MDERVNELSKTKRMNEWANIFQMSITLWCKFFSKQCLIRNWVDLLNNLNNQFTRIRTKLDYTDVLKEDYTAVLKDLRKSLKSTMMF